MEANEKCVRKVTPTREMLIAAGQYYEVSCQRGDGTVMEAGWTSVPDGGKLRRMIESHPDWHSPKIVDIREANDRLPSAPMREEEAGKATENDGIHGPNCECKLGFVDVKCPYYHGTPKAHPAHYVPFTESDACWCQPFDGPIHPHCPMHGAPTLEGAGEKPKWSITEAQLLVAANSSEDMRLIMAASFLAVESLLLTALTERDAALKDNAELKEMFELHKALITRCLCAGIVFQGDDEPLVNERAEKAESERNAAVSRAEKAEAVILEILSYLAHTYSDKSHMRLSRCCRGALHGAFDTAMKYQPTLVELRGK